jgi:hypothetical protein
MKESAVFDSLTSRNRLGVGVENLPSVFVRNLKEFSHREFPTFKSPEEAVK